MRIDVSMGKLHDWLHKRRSKFYEGDALESSIGSFLAMVDAGAEVHEFPDAIIVLEDYLQPGVARGWLLFDKFTKGTVSAIKKVCDEFKGTALCAETHDERIRNLLVKLGFAQVYRDAHDYYMIFKKGACHGV